MSLAYPTRQPLCKFLMNDEPLYDPENWRGDTQPMEPLDIRIIDIADDDDFDIRDGDLGGL